MNKSHVFDDYLKQLNQEISAHNRKWLLDLMEHIAAKAQVDVSQLSESVLLNAPDVETIANDIIVQNTVLSMLDDAVFEAVAVPTFADIMDDSLRRTIVDTDFVEAFLDNFRDAVAPNSLALLCAEKLETLAAQVDVSSFVEEPMKILAEQHKVSEDFGELVSELAVQKETDVELDKILKGFATNTELSTLLSERIGELAKNSEALRSIDQVMHDIMAQAGFGSLDADVRKELNRAYQRAVARLIRDIETESYRHLPWDIFLDRTYGSLADDPIERPENVEPGVQDELE